MSRALSEKALLLFFPHPHTEKDPPSSTFDWLVLIAFVDGLLTIELVIEYMGHSQSEVEWGPCRMRVGQTLFLTHLLPLAAFAYYAAGLTFHNKSMVVHESAFCYTN